MDHRAVQHQRSQPTIGVSYARIAATAVLAGVVVGITTGVILHYIDRAVFIEAGVFETPDVRWNDSSTVAAIVFVSVAGSMVWVMLDKTRSMTSPLRRTASALVGTPRYRRTRTSGKHKVGRNLVVLALMGVVGNMLVTCVLAAAWGRVFFPRNSLKVPFARLVGTDIRYYSVDAIVAERAGRFAPETRWYGPHVSEFPPGDPSWSKVRSTEEAIATELAVGWPYRCCYCFSKTECGNEVTVGSLHGQLSNSGMDPKLDGFVVPYIPLWRGFFANAVFWAGVLALAFGVARAFYREIGSIRATDRLFHVKCCRCGYPLLEGACSECGWTDPTGHTP